MHLCSYPTLFSPVKKPLRVSVVRSRLTSYCLRFCVSYAQRHRHTLAITIDEMRNGMLFMDTFMTASYSFFRFSLWSAKKTTIGPGPPKFLPPVCRSEWLRFDAPHLPHSRRLRSKPHGRPVKNLNIIVICPFSILGWLWLSLSGR